MNKERRENIERAQQLLEETKGILESARYEEQDYADNLPESMDAKRDAAEEAAGRIGEAVDQIEEVVSSCEDATAS